MGLISPYHSRMVIVSEGWVYVVVVHIVELRVPRTRACSGLRMALLEDGGMMKC